MNNPKINDAVSEAQYAQGDLVRAAQQIVMHNLPLTTEGAVECERIMREFGEGNRALWGHPTYLRTTINMAQEIVREAHQKKRPGQ
jgi:hypothetical protein